MNNQNFTYSFQSAQSIEAIFNQLVHVEKWWSGIYGETIEGKSEKINDEFSFKAGGGAHYTKHRLTELVPGKRIAWLVTDASLTFAKPENEWEGTTFGFDLHTEDDNTIVTFTHHGLLPRLECYNQCSAGWTSYLNALKAQLG